MKILQKANLPIYVGLVLLDLYSVNHQIYLHDAKKPSGETFAHLKIYHNFYLTNWNFIFQLIFMIVAIFDEISKLMKFSLTTQKRLNKTRAVMYNTILFPSTLLVMSIFWILWFTNRELVFPKALDVFFPSWLNHMLHTFILMPVVIELLLPKKYNFVKFEKSAVVLSVLFTCYQILYFSVYIQHGVWLYAVYKVLTWPQRIIFTVCQLFLVLGYQKLGIILQNSKKPQLRLKAK